MLIRRYRMSVLWEPEEQQVANRISDTGIEVAGVRLEHCFYIEIDSDLSQQESRVLDWLLSETFEPEKFGNHSSLSGTVLEVGPRVEIVTPWSTNAVKICHSCGLTAVKRIERSRRYQIDAGPGVELSGADVERIYPLLYDRMTESVYLEPVTTFEPEKIPEPVKLVPLLKRGMSALEELDMSFDKEILEHNYNYFVSVIKKNPTDVELTQLDQVQSDHSRHRRFNAIWQIDGATKQQTLMKTIKENYQRHTGHTLVAFEDNSSVIKGHKVPLLVYSDPSRPSQMIVENVAVEMTAKGESHNHPTAITSPAGAGTGTGGRIRDNQTVGRGGTAIAGSTLYLVGNLFIPGYDLPWEKHNWQHPFQLETPLQIIIGAPKGAYRYGNEYGEPTISGSTTSFEYVHGDGADTELFSFTKCGMWTMGVGWIDGRHLKKHDPEKGYQIVQLGGDAYRIGLGGASGSSKTLGSQAAELDWNSVQRANAEMEKVFDRVIQACIMMGDNNPIKSIHDLGAGGDSNAVTEIIYPAGGKIYLRRIPCGDKTMSVMELWCNESQERVVLLVSKEDLHVIESIARREKCPLAVIGEISGDGKQVIIDEAAPADAPEHEKTPVDLDLSFVLGKIPQMVIEDRSAARKLTSLSLPEGTKVRDALDRVLRLLKVSSKSFLVNHVDRSVTGFIAQQQCAGPLQLAVADVAVTADSYFAGTGRCWALGDQPIKWIVDSEASVRMAAGEALTNLVWAQIVDFNGISMLGNWGMAASEPGEGDRLYRANESLNAMLDKLGISINGGKDSMSMAARVQRDGTDGMAKAPGTLVITAYASCKDVNKTVTPDIKRAGSSSLMLIDLSGSKSRTGGSALAQVYNQVGNQSPNVDDPQILKSGFEAVQRMIADDLILAGHDVSDGGLITCLLEMAFAGNCGLDIKMNSRADAGAIDYLFAEELGLVIEYAPDNEDTIKGILKDHGLTDSSYAIGRTTADKQIRVAYNGTRVLSEDMRELRSIWQETSYQIEKLQANPKCAESEFKSGYDRSGLKFNLSFTPEPTPEDKLKSASKPKIAILREEGVNGDREMAGAFYSAGFEPWDVTMTDIAEGRIGLDKFRGIAFCGGFAYADVLDSGRGWAAGVLFNDVVKRQFDAFYARNDTFSLGVCNGCQVMAFLGWVPWPGLDIKQQPRFVLNESEMFESRFIAVKIYKSPAIMLEDMEGSVLGVSVAHGEGRFYCTDESLVQELESRNLTPLRFVDDSGSITETYPANPNGSRQGITSMCSPDGRHLAIMPHPERFFLPWQWQYWPQEWADLKVSPWLKMFQNARQWCEK